MTSRIDALKILWLLLTLATLLDASPAIKKERKAPVNFRFSKDLTAEATNHEGM